MYHFVTPLLKVLESYFPAQIPSTAFYFHNGNYFDRPYICNFLIYTA